MSFLHPATSETETCIVATGNPSGFPPLEEGGLEETANPGFMNTALSETDASSNSNPVANQGTTTSANELELLQQALAESGGAEIICLVRSQDDPSSEPSYCVDQQSDSQVDQISESECSSRDHSRNASGAKSKSEPDEFDSGRESHS
ncbi:MAG: hypothetical protein R3C11_08975 [Planctomycetaceae bacterium]